MSVGAWGDVWLDHIARALMETDGRPRLIVFYEDFFREPHRQLERIASFLGVEPPDLDDPGSSPLGEIEAGLRHHSTSVLELAGVTGISPAARTVFFALRAAHDIRARECEEDGLSIQRAQALERVAPELWSERRLLNDVRTALEHAQQTTAQLQEETRQLTDETTRTREEHAELRTLLERERERFHDELAIAVAAVNQAREDSRASAGRCGAAEAAGSELEARLERQGAVLRGVQSSLSWRVTAPLRAVKRIAPNDRDARAVVIHVLVRHPPATELRRAPPPSGAGCLLVTSRSRRRPTTRSLTAHVCLLSSRALERRNRIAPLALPSLDYATPAVCSTKCLLSIVS